MSRAGREPAEDVKRRIVAACEQAGLTVLSAHMYLRHGRDGRFIHVHAASPSRPFEQASIGIVTIVTLGGDFSGRVDLKCAACEKDSDPPRVWDIPVMRGRDAVPLDELAEALKKTVEEQEQVIAAIKMGVDEPYVFAETRWAKPPAIMMPWIEG